MIRPSEFRTGTDEVLELDAATGSIVQRISVDRRPREIDEPHGIAVAPDGQHWYVSLAHGNPSLWKFERAGNRLVGRLTLDMPGAARIAITPDGRQNLLGKRCDYSGRSVIVVGPELHLH